MVLEASEHKATHAVSSSTERLLQQLLARFTPEMRLLKASMRDSVPVREISRSASLELLMLDSPSRAIASAPTGGIAADINPLLNDRSGQRFAQSATAVATFDHAWQLGRHFSAQLQPRVAGGGVGANKFSELTLQTGSVAFEAHNVLFNVGRQQIVWGQGIEGGMLLSTSGRPLDAVTIAVDHPFQFPHPIQWLGQFRGTILVADLGARQNFPHAKIVAYKGSSAVTSFLELGISMMVQQGGRGAPGASFTDHFFDFFPFRNDKRANPPQFSNKLGGFDARVRIPMLHNAQLYAESIFDDIDPHRLMDAFLHDAGHIAGVSLTQLGPDGALSATGEFHRTGLRYYRHTPFTSGVTFNRSLLGDPLGPEGDGANLRIRFNRGGRQSWKLDAAIERRSGDVWSTTSQEPNASNFHFVLDEAKPAEWRHRAQLEWTLRVKSEQRLTVQAGVESVRNFGFANGANRVNSIAGIQYAWLAW